VKLCSELSSSIPTALRLRKGPAQPTSSGGTVDERNDSEDIPQKVANQPRGRGSTSTAAAQRAGMQNTVPRL